MNEPRPGDYYAAYIEDIKAALNSALQPKAKKAEFVTQHSAGWFKGPEQHCARCGKVIAVIGESEPFSFSVGITVFENCLGEIDTKPGTLFRLPCQKEVIEHLGLEWALKTFVK